MARLVGRFLPALIMFIACGCPSQPPSVGTGKDIDRLDVATKHVGVRRLSNKDLPALARLKQLEYLDFAIGYGAFDAPITDQGLKTLSNLDLPKLDYLAFWRCDNISDAGLADIAQMQTIKHLLLVDCQRITDDGLPHLLKMKQLIYLDLRGCSGITDRGLERLSEKDNWENILFGGCPNVTEAAVAKLQAKLPRACY